MSLFFLCFQLKTKQEYQQKMFLQDKQKKKRTSAPLVSTNHQRTLRNLLKDQYVIIITYS